MTCERARKKHGLVGLMLITLPTFLSDRGHGIGEMNSVMIARQQSSQIVMRGFHPKLSTKKNIKEEMVIFT